MTIVQLKGFISEEIAKYHMQKLEYNVVPIGREKIEPELSNLLLFIRGNMGHLNKQNKNSFELFEKTISKLPDYAIWKTTPTPKANVMTFRFLEVKYRTHISKLKKHATDDKYYLNITKQDDEQELSIHKYIENLSNLFGISTNNTNKSINDIEFYIYLITIIDGKNTPLIGKITTSEYSDYFTYLFTPEQLAKTPSLKALWGNDYDKIASFFMNDGKLDSMLSDSFLIPLIGKSNDEISQIVFEKLNTNY